MSLRTGWMRSLPILLAMGLVAAGCGDDDDAATDTTSAASGETTATAADTTAAADTTSGTTAPGATTTSAATATTAAGGSITVENPLISPGVPDNYDPNGEMTFGYVVGTAHLDPHKGPAQALLVNLYPIYDRLTSITDDYEVEPMLATDWQFADDGSSLEMNLRSGVTFHDGTPFNAEAVKVNIERAKEQDSVTAPYLQSVSGVEVVDDDTVRFTLDGGGAEVPAMLATNAGMMISPAAIAGGVDLANSPGDAGSGPYKVVQFVPNERVVYEQAQAPGEHWDAGAGLLKRFTWLYVAQGAQRINGVQAGDLDLGHITGVDVGQADALVESGQFDGRHVTLATTEQALLIKSSREAVSNVKLRQAMNFATDKVAIADGLFGGNCTVATQFLPENHWAYSEKAAGLYTYDLEKAKQLVAESGVANPSLEIVFFSIYEQPAAAMQAQLSEAGFNVSLLPVQPADVAAGMREGRYDAQQQVLTSPVPDPFYILGFIYLAGTELVAPADKPPLQELAAQAVDPTLTQEERAAIYEDLFFQLEEGAYAVPICHSEQVWLQQKGSIGGIDSLLYTWNGQVDARYLYAIG